MKLAAASLLASVAFASPARFEGDQVWRLRLSEEQAGVVSMLAEVLGDSAEWWKEPSRTGVADLHVSADHTQAVTTMLQLAGIEHEVLIKDVQALADQETFGDSAPGSLDWYKEYHTHEQNLQWIEDMVSAYDGQSGLTVESFSVATSTEGRDVRGIRFTGSTPTTPCSSTWVFNGNQHAREWLTTPVVQYQVESLLETHVSNSTALLDQSCWHVVPGVNPDGYEYSRLTNRMWRKSRKPNAGSSAMGTDLNRNWPYQWGGTGSSGVPGSDTYRGAAPEDNPEIHGLMNYMRGIESMPSPWKDTDGIEWYTDVHTYGNYILTPWGYTSSLPADYDCQMCVAYGTRDAIASVNGNSYLTGPSGATLYPTSGSAPDTAYGPRSDNSNNPSTGFDEIMHAWTFELSAGNGFTWPAERILEICYEIEAGMQWLTDEITFSHPECARECAGSSAFLKR